MSDAWRNTYHGMSGTATGDRVFTMLAHFAACGRLTKNEAIAWNELNDFARQFYAERNAVRLRRIHWEHLPWWKKLFAAEPPTAEEWTRLRSEATPSQDTPTP